MQHACVAGPTDGGARCPGGLERRGVHGPERGGSTAGGMMERLKRARMGRPHEARQSRGPARGPGTQSQKVGAKPGGGTGKPGVAGGLGLTCGMWEGPKRVRPLWSTNVSHVWDIVVLDSAGRLEMGPPSMVIVLGIRALGVVSARFGQRHKPSTSFCTLLRERWVARAWPLYSLSSQMYPV